MAGRPKLDELRISILADIHSNLEALTAVLADAEGRGAIDQIWCLGDMVGYGPDPGPCLDMLMSLELVAVAGNHELAVVGKIGLEDFNPYAAEACRWTATQLSRAQCDYLTRLPLREVVSPFTLVHGSPRDPAWEYLVSVEAALECFDLFGDQVCLVGHTHIPCIFHKTDQGADLVQTSLEYPIPLDERKLIINPGSVGQPRDGDPRASYVIYDSDAGSLEFRRVKYDVVATQQKIRKAGLPQYLAERLAFGR